MVTSDPTREGGPLGSDADSYAALVEAQYEPCMRFAMRMLRHRADAEDAVQEAFLRALQSHRRYDASRPFRPWLFSILVNQCRTALLQRARRDHRFPHDQELVAQAADPRAGPTIEVDGSRDAIAAALDELEPLLREAFLLKHVEQLEYGEMSEITGASVSALKMRVKRACDALRPRLEGIANDQAAKDGT
jgi:RNA polymerase sigma-70 factor (ECF subfamily)